MKNIGLETKSKHCRKCHWCAKYDDYDVMANTHTPVYHCQFPGGNWKGGRQEEPTLDKDCPYFNERYKDEDEEGD